MMADIPGDMIQYYIQIMYYVKQLIEKGYEICADLEGYTTTNVLFNGNVRPDIAVKKGNN